ncbi:hypothetical protein [Streptomyces sp. 142MFCol3.1]|uniref:hypothetical protein n=1 Tax=Streptomyces sp. 142MFCol3.1 TaxID=1172179 RepID=UPI000413D140|nr:hypothetical protein [Streptomyces sp. 142MFCol3.1]
MREKPLSKIGKELTRLRHEVSHATARRSAPEGFGLDRALVSGLVSDSLSPQDEATLAKQVAQLLPFHWAQSNTLAVTMTEIVDHLGGHRELMAWLDRFPGLPRLTARLYVLLGLLDQYSEEHAVVRAFREYREHTPYPPGLRGYLVPQTDDSTLAGLAFRIEELLGDGEVTESVDLALATATCVEQIAPRAEELDATVGDMGAVMEHMVKDLREADSAV